MLTILRINRAFMEYMRANFSEIARTAAKQPFNQTIVADADAAAPAAAPAAASPAAASSSSAAGSSAAGPSAAGPSAAASSSSASTTVEV